MSLTWNIHTVVFYFKICFQPTNKMMYLWWWTMSTLEKYKFWYNIKITEWKRHDDTNTEYRLVKDNKGKRVCNIYVLKLKYLPKEQLMSHLCFCTMWELWVGRPVTASLCTDNMSFLSMFKNTCTQQNTWKAKPDKPAHPALPLFILTFRGSRKRGWAITWSPAKPMS